MVREKIKILLSKIPKLFSFGELYVSRLVLLVITFCCAIYAAVGIRILCDRPDNMTITSQEVALIVAFAGVNGVAFALHKKGKDK